MGLQEARDTFYRCWPHRFFVFYEGFEGSLQRKVAGIWLFTEKGGERLKSNMAGILAFSHVGNRKMMREKEGTDAEVQDAFVESGIRLRKIFENLSEAVIYIDKYGKILDLNRKALELYGGSKEELLGKHFTRVNIFSPKNMLTLMKNFKKILSGEETRVNVSFKNKKGQNLSLQCSTYAVRINGELDGFLVILTDITERRKAELQAKEAREYAEDIVESVVSANSAFYRTFKVTPERVEKHSIYELSKYKLDIAELRTRLQQVLAENVAIEDFEVEHNFPKIGWRIMLLNARRVSSKTNKEPLILLAIEDGTRRKEAEKELLFQRKLFDALMDNIPDAIYFKDAESRFIRINKAHAMRMGLKAPEEAIGKMDFDFYPLEFAQKAYEDEQNIVKTGKPLLRKTERIVDKNGQVRWVSATKVPIRDDLGQVVGIVGISRDITKLKQMEKKLRKYSQRLEEMVKERTRQLRKSEEKYRRLIQHIPDVTWTSTQEGKTIFISDNVKQVFGYTPEEIYRKGERLWFGRIHPDDLEKVKKAYKALFEKGEPYEVEYRIRRKDGKWIWLYDRARTTYWNAGRRYADGALGKKIVKSMPSSLAFKPRFEKICEAMERQVQYMDKIVSDLQDYARPMRLELAETSLLTIMKNVLKTLSIPKNIEVAVMVPEDFPALLVDSHLMTRVFTNLVLNAFQAMPQGGRLTIEASLTDKEALVHVKDTGIGIEKENISKIFNPLFTTKAKGQGLGLPVCKRIVEAHGGSITVQSTVNKGTIFTVKIPLRQEVKKGG
ncbi:hypothetical protein B6U79_04085 [Candidatus Bathyarchaeota archaeon ex4484_231]|nr:MAG: hypothetical protein B6U79_04085 [Candidatus Bathyarchaeota archaeon ex4484_231]